MVEFEEFMFALSRVLIIRNNFENNYKRTTSYKFPNENPSTYQSHHGVR